MSVVPFPPRDAGPVLARAMEAAAAAAKATIARTRPNNDPWLVLCAVPPLDEETIRLAAISASLPIIAGLTADPAMQAIVAHGMAVEAMIRLRKAGAA